MTLGRRRAVSSRCNRSRPTGLRRPFRRCVQPPRGVVPSRSTKGLKRILTHGMRLKDAIASRLPSFNSDTFDRWIQPSIRVRSAVSTVITRVRCAATQLSAALTSVFPAHRPQDNDSFAKTIGTDLIRDVDRSLKIKAKRFFLYSAAQAGTVASVSPWYQ